MVVVAVPAAQAFVCGNGVLEPGEQCDVAQTVDGNDRCDGCGPSCLLNEECGNALCTDGLDNDGDMRVDSEDSECSSFPQLQAVALLGSGSMAPALAVLKGNRLRVEEGTVASSPLSYPYGPSKAEMCGASAFVGTAVALEGSLTSLGYTQFSHSVPAGVAEELVLTAPSNLNINRQEPMIGAPLGTCSISAGACLTVLDCASTEEVCEGRLRISGNPAVDLTGVGAGSDNLARCQSALAGLGAVSSELSALGLDGQETLVVTAEQEQVVYLEPGLNVFTYRSVHIGKAATLVFDGPVDAVVVMQIRDGFRMWSGSQVVVSGGISARNVLWHFPGENLKDLRFGINSQLVGTVVAPHRRLRILGDASLRGALHGQSVRMAKRSSLRHVPFTALLPADLRVVGQVPASVVPGGEVSYSATITNQSLSSAAATTATFSLDSDLVFTSATPSQGTCVHDGSPSGGQVKCFLGHLAPQTLAPGNEVTVAMTLHAANTMTTSQSIAVIVAHAVNEVHTSDNSDEDEITPDLP